MKSLKNIFKSKKGSSTLGFIALLSLALFLIFWTISFDEPTLSNQNHTVVSEMSIDENTTKEALNTLKEKEPTTQNIVINNIVKDKNEDFLHDFNLNIISDLASTALIGIIGFFIGKLSKKKKLKI